MTVNIAGSLFDSNIGALTNEVFFGDSVANLKIGSDKSGTRSTWIIDDKSDTPPVLAKVLYRPPTSRV